MDALSCGLLSAGAPRGARRLRVIFGLLFISASLACGGESGPTAHEQTQDVWTDVQNWDFRPEEYVDRVMIFSGSVRGLSALSGVFAWSSTAVGASLHPWGGCRTEEELPAPFRGTRSGSAIDMQATVNDVTTRVYGTLSPDMESFSGSYAMTGGSCGLPETPAAMVGQRVRLDGTWSDENLTLTLASGAVPVNGSFRISGTVSFANDSCFGQGTVSNIARGRLVFPDLTADDSRYIMTAELSADGERMSYYYWPELGSHCRGLGEGELVKD